LTSPRASRAVVVAARTTSRRARARPAAAAADAAHRTGPGHRSAGDARTGRGARSTVLGAKASWCARAAVLQAGDDPDASYSPRRCAPSTAPLQKPARRGAVEPVRRGAVHLQPRRVVLAGGRTAARSRLHVVLEARGYFVVMQARL